MDYAQTLEYLYARLPMYQRIGAAAFKKDLTNTLRLCEHLGNPEHKFRSIHIAGTNGKGSTSNMLAAILQSQGYTVGLYTSPHLTDFRERIRINGQMISQQSVVEFVQSYRHLLEAVNPSFFEATVAMCFWYFAQQKVDYAVIETGLGGRLDSTNVISPIFSLITQISWDHADMLGDTLPKIAAEKAGIIKARTPIFISETQPDIAEVFAEKAAQMSAPLTFADQLFSCREIEAGTIDILQSNQVYLAAVKPALIGRYQHKNIIGVVAASQWMMEQGILQSRQSIRSGIENCTRLTGFRGRWEQLGQRPYIFCDIAHNQGGIQAVVEEINRYPFQKLYMVIGMVADKDHSKILPLLPQNAYYIFCEPSVVRRLAAQKLAEIAAPYGLKGEVIPQPLLALQRAKELAGEQDFIFVGGSTFVVGDLG